MCVMCVLELYSYSWSYLNRTFWTDVHVIVAWYYSLQYMLNVNLNSQNMPCCGILILVYCLWIFLMIDWVWEGHMFREFFKESLPIAHMYVHNMHINTFILHTCKTGAKIVIRYTIPLTESGVYSSSPVVFNQKRKICLKWDVNFYSICIFISFILLLSSHCIMCCSICVIKYITDRPTPENRDQ